MRQCYSRSIVANNYTITLRIAFGTADLRVDLVSGDTTLPTLINGLDTRGTGDNSSFTFPVSRKKGSFNKISIVGTLAEYTYVPRNDDVSPTRAVYISLIELILLLISDWSQRLLHLGHVQSSVCRWNYDTEGIV